jgi:hypothetical protein
MVSGLVLCTVSDKPATRLMRRSRVFGAEIALICDFVEPMMGIEPAYSAWEVDSTSLQASVGV